MDIPKLFAIILKSKQMDVCWNYTIKKGLNTEFNLKRRSLEGFAGMLASMCHVKSDWDLFAPFSVSKATLPWNPPVSFAIWLMEPDVG